MFNRRTHRLFCLLLAAAVLFTAPGAAAAAACAHPIDVPAVSEQDAGAQHCAMAQAECCCGPAVASAATSPSGAGIGAERCACSIQAPAPAPAAAQNRGLQWNQAPDAVLPAAADASHRLPLTRPWIFGAPAVGPPGGPALSTGPSRAPPACL